MKPEDIITGARYGHIMFPGVIYLGIISFNFDKQDLVIIKDPTSKTVGRIVGDGDEFFKGFYKL